LESRADFGQIDLAQLGWHHTPIMPEEKRSADPVFQQADMSADRTMCDARFKCGRLQAAQPRGGFECAKGIERWDLSLHLSVFRTNLSDL
jgi:hypothetical protein